MLEENSLSLILFTYLLCSSLQETILDKKIEIAKQNSQPYTYDLGYV